MKASRRNIVIAVVLLAVLLVLPFWPKIRQALAPAAGEEVSCTVTVACQAEALPELRAAGGCAGGGWDPVLHPLYGDGEQHGTGGLENRRRSCRLPGDHPG